MKLEYLHQKGLPPMLILIPAGGKWEEGESEERFLSLLLIKTENSNQWFIVYFSTWNTEYNYSHVGFVVFRLWSEILPDWLWQLIQVEVDVQTQGLCQHRVSIDFCASTSERTGVWEFTVNLRCFLSKMSSEHRVQKS